MNARIPSLDPAAFLSGIAQAALGARPAHVLKRESTGGGISDSTTPTCSCGWRGKPAYQSDDFMSSHLAVQERAHINGSRA